MPEQPNAPRPDVVDDTEVVVVRRSPRYGVFLSVGVALGLVAAVVLTFAFRGNDQSATGMVYTDGQVLGFLALIGVAVGAALGGITAIVLEWTVGRRTRRLTADHARVRLR